MITVLDETEQQILTFSDFGFKYNFEVEHKYLYRIDNIKLVRP
jgi:hypothetical protein